MFAPTAHRLMMISEGSAQVESNIQLGPSIPTTLRALLIRPILGLKICSHSTATATPEMTDGR